MRDFRIRRRQMLTLFACGLPAFVPVTMRAASTSTESPPGLLDLHLEQLMQLPIEFVSGVSKYEQSVRDAPAGVTVFTAADIRNYGWRTLSDALRAAPGFHIRSDRFYDYVGNRGFTRPYDYNSRTLVLINGHRINDAIYQQGSVGTEFILDLDLIERIEIIRGPGSSVYGSNAFYGAINIIPKKGRDFSGGQAAVTVGSEPSAKGRVTVGERTQSGVEYTISATGWTSRGENNFDLPDTWRARDPSLTARQAKGQDGLEHRSAYANVSWRGFEAETGYVRRLKEVLPPVYFTNVNTPAHGIDERGYALLRASGEPTPDANLTAKIAIDYYRYDGRFSPAFAQFQPLEICADSISIDSELRWHQTFAARHELIAGVEYQEHFRQNFGRRSLANNSIDVRVRASSRYISPFTQFDWEINEAVILSVGARYDHYSTGEHRPTPRIGLIWNPTTATTLKLLYGESFRVPNIEERDSPEEGVISNPELGPETNQTGEIAAEHRLNSTWRLDGHLYHISSNDLITTVPTFANPADPNESTYANVQNFTTTGLDLGTTAYFTNGVQFRASGTLQYTKDNRTKSSASDAPRTLLKLAASTPLGPKWLRASGELQHVGERLDGDGAPLGDYLIANLTVRAAPVWRRWDLAVSIYNLGDVRWNDAKNSGHIVSAPQSVIIRVVCDF